MTARSKVKAVLASVLRYRDADVRSVRWRLDELGGPGSEVSGVFPPHDSAHPDAWLLDLASRLIPRTRQTTIDGLADRNPPPLLNFWPGEHYRLLASLVHDLSPRRIVEIGTLTGLSALSILGAMSREARLVTFDIVPWREFPETYLREDDFASGQLVQVVGNVGDRAFATAERQILVEADLVFIDAAKDGHLERSILSNLDHLGLKNGAVVVLDDIHVWNMLTIWREVDRPKLDLTSFGHYSGTGLIHWVSSGA